MAITKGDFVEIEFTGTVTDTKEVFDTTNKEEAKKANLNVAGIKPLVLAVGKDMLPKGFDSALEGNEVGVEYTIHLEAKDAFGARDSKLVQMVPTRLFHAQKINPVRGMQLSLEGQLVKILSSDHGRTLVDFNGPLAGKRVTYTYQILRTIPDETEQINAVQDFLFRRTFDFKINGETVTFRVEKGQEMFIEIFSKKFKEITGKEIRAEIKEKKEAKNEEGTGKKEAEKDSEELLQ